MQMTLLETQTSSTGGVKFLALAERGLPYALDPDTLETRGPDPYGGQVAAKTFAAHPKVGSPQERAGYLELSCKGPQYSGYLHLLD